MSRVELLALAKDVLGPDTRVTILKARHGWLAEARNHVTRMNRRGDGFDRDVAIEHLIGHLLALKVR